MSLWGTGELDLTVVTVPEALPPLQCLHLVGATSSAASLEDPRLALQLYYRVKEQLPATIGNLDLLAVRPRMELLRYRERCCSTRPGDQPHPTDPLLRHVFTLQLFLNDGFEGGALNFPSLDRTVEPEAGRAVIFNHELDVEHGEVTDGEKVVLQASIYYIAGRMQARLRH